MFRPSPAPSPTNLILDFQYRSGKIIVKVAKIEAADGGIVLELPHLADTLGLRG